jgi:2'-5' RNA ligase
MRTFVALELPEEFLEALEKQLQIWRENHPAFRWTKAENLHITLAFLGEINEREAAILKEAAGTAARGMTAFPISAGRVVTLPSGRSAHVLALGIGEGREQIAGLAARFGRIPGLPGNNRGSGADRKTFTPHITLARKGGVPLAFPPEERNLAIPGQGIVRGLTVFMSELFRGGPVYTPLARFPFMPVSGVR